MIDRTPRAPHPIIEPLALAYELSGLLAWFQRTRGALSALEAHAFERRLKDCARAAGEIAATAAVVRACAASAPAPAGPGTELLAEFLARRAAARGAGRPA